MKTSEIMIYYYSNIFRCIGDIFSKYTTLNFRNWVFKLLKTTQISSEHENFLLKFLECIEKLIEWNEFYLVHPVFEWFVINYPSVLSNELVSKYVKSVLKNFDLTIKNFYELMIFSKNFNNFNKLSHIHIDKNDSTEVIRWIENTPKNINPNSNLIEFYKVIKNNFDL